MTAAGKRATKCFVADRHFASGIKHHGQPLAIELGFGDDQAPRTAPRLNHDDGGIVRALADATAIPLAAQATCAPVVVLLQGSVPIIGVVANLGAAVFVAPATVAGVLAALTAAVWTPAGTVLAVDGSTVRADVASICVHGDTPGAVDLAGAVRTALTDAGVVLAPFAGGAAAGVGTLSP